MGDILARPSTRLYYTYIVILVHPISLYLYMKRRVDVGCCHLLYANEYYRRHVLCVMGDMDVRQSLKLLTVIVRFAV